MSVYQRMLVAEEIQDACNPIAVCGTLQKMAKEITQEQDMTAIPADPAFIAVLDKLNDMVGRPGINSISNAHRACQLASESISA